MTFDCAQTAPGCSPGDLLATGFDSQTVSRFDSAGNLKGSFGGGYDSNPESIVQDAAGNFYVGQADGSHQVRKFDAAGTLLATFSPAVEERGTDWIDLAADQCTLLYTSESTHIKRFNVCTNTQLPDFSPALAGSHAFAMRIRPNQEVLVADTSAVHRLDKSGSVIQTYTLPGTFNDSNALFALNLDPDLTSFWTAAITGGQVFRVDINSGAILASFTVPPNNSAPGEGLGGLAVFGEVTPPRPSLDSTPPR